MGLKISCVRRKNEDKTTQNDHAKQEGKQTAPHDHAKQEDKKSRTNYCYPEIMISSSSEDKGQSTKNEKDAFKELLFNLQDNINSGIPNDFITRSEDTPEDLHNRNKHRQSKRHVSAPPSVQAIPETYEPMTDEDMEALLEEQHLYHVFSCESVESSSEVETQYYMSPGSFFDTRNGKSVELLLGSTVITTPSEYDGMRAESRGSEAQHAGYHANRIAVDTMHIY